MYHLHRLFFLVLAVIFTWLSLMCECVADSLFAISEWCERCSAFKKTQPRENVRRPS